MKACTGHTMPATIIPSLRYRNAPAAIEWLCRVFGLQKNLVVPDDSGGVAHAQLRSGDGMMMLGSVRDNEWGRFIKQPDENRRSCNAICLPHRARRRSHLRTSKKRRRRNLNSSQGRGVWRAQLFL